LTPYAANGKFYDTALVMHNGDQCSTPEFSRQHSPASSEDAFKKPSKDQSRAREPPTQEQSRLREPRGRSKDLISSDFSGSAVTSRVRLQVPAAQPQDDIQKSMSSDSVLRVGHSRDSESMTPSTSLPQMARQRTGSKKILSNKGEDTRGFLRRVVESDTYELLFACLILASALLLALEAEYLGWETGDKADLPGKHGRAAEDNWPHVKGVLRVCELFLGITFTIEVIVKLAAYRLLFPCMAWNMLDAIIVGVWLFEQSSGSLLAGEVPIPPLVLRMARLARAFRLLRLARSVQFADSLNLMVISIQSSVSVATWSIVMLSIIMLFVGLILNHILKEYIEDTSIDEEKRLEVFLYFGTCTRSFLTMLELTDGNWIPVTRALQENVSQWASAFIILYRLVVAFTIIKVITGVFLHETMRVAGSNDELMITGKIRERLRYRSKMQALFREADNSSDGHMSKEEFLNLLRDDRVKAWFSATGLDLRDPDHVWTLFEFDDDSENIDVNKFITAVARLRGPAQRVDLLTLTDSMDRIGMAIQDLLADKSHPLPYTIRCKPAHAECEPIF